MKYQEFYSLYLSAADSRDFESFVAEEGLPPCFAEYPDERILPIFKAIWELRDNPIRGIKKVCNLTNQYLSSKYGIPIKTVEAWLAGTRVSPEYVSILLTYCVLMDEEII